jgi:hypothetical protein
MPPTNDRAFVARPTYDLLRSRHSINGVDMVLHSQQYLSLCTQLADDAVLFAGKEILRSAAESTFHRVLRDTLSEQNAPSEGRVRMIEEYWAFCGMGRLRVTSVRAEGGQAEMSRSHVDEGWAEMFGQRPRPVNFITQGYLAAAFAVLHDRPTGSYQVEETQSIVSGAKKSIFRVTRK